MKCCWGISQIQSLCFCLHSADCVLSAGVCWYGPRPCNSRKSAADSQLPAAEVGSEGWICSWKLNAELVIYDTLPSDRTGLLLRLLQVQEDFEASVKDMLEALDGLWARLELLHTGVTLSKQGTRGHKDLASASTDAEVSRLVHEGVIFTRKESSWQLMQICWYISGEDFVHSYVSLREKTAVLPDSPERQHPAATGKHLWPHWPLMLSEVATQSAVFPQELTWSHTHISNHMSRSCSIAESVWPELLLQSNIEQVSGRFTRQKQSQQN